VLLDPAVGRARKVRAENPKRDRKKLCVYVGMTGLSPEERFAIHEVGSPYFGPKTQNPKPSALFPQ
jgi:hypothetical protein